MRTYTAWVSEADQRAAGILAARMPTKPVASPAIAFTELGPSSPYERIAVTLRAQILNGELQADLPLPSMQTLAAAHDCSVSTVQRAVKLLDEWGLVELNSGRRTLVKRRAVGASTVTSTPDVQPSTAGQCSTQPQALDLEVQVLGTSIGKFRAEADPGNTEDLRQLLVGVIRRRRVGDIADIGGYELTVRLAGNANLLTTFVATK